MAAGVAIALGRKVARASTDACWANQSNANPIADLQAARRMALKQYGGIPQPGDPHPSIDVTGKPTPDWLPRGEPMQTYFHVKDGSREMRRCFLNGIDVSRLASECDTQGGWVRMYAGDGNGKFPTPCGTNAVERIHFGKVEIR